MLAHVFCLRVVRTQMEILSVLLLLLPYASSAQSWSWNWVRKIGTAGLNDPFCVIPLNSDIIYCSPGNNTIVISRDRGRTWQTFSTITGGNQVKALIVHWQDTSVMLAAQEAGPPDRIMKTTNRGATWFQTLSGNFYYWGHPLAYEPLLQNDIVYTEASNVLYRSTNFGSTWDSLRVNPFSSNNQGWEDAFIRPDSGNILVVSDNANGIWKSTTAGTTWRRVYTASGEVPALALNIRDPKIAFGTKFGGGGGLVKTTDFGETWQLVPGFSGKNMWGVAISPENPNYVVANTWGHSFASDGGAYISRDGGTTWERTYQGFVSSSNHAMFVLDTMSVFALQGDGIYKLQFPGRISGDVFHDRNGNGARDSGEAGLYNRLVRLSGTRSDSVLTDPLGKFQFGLLAAGNYIVTCLPGENGFLTYPPLGTYSLAVTDGEQYQDRSFGVALRMIGLARPNGGERWAIGDTQAITWTSSFLTGYVRIELSRDGGQSYTLLFDSTLNDGTENWVVSGPATGAALMRVSSLVFPTVSDVSDSTFTIAGPNDVATIHSQPHRFALYQNYPNPFNPSTRIKFSVPSARDLVPTSRDGQIPNLKPQTVSLKVYDVLGREVRTLVNEDLQPGSYEVTFSATGLPSGVYLYRLTTSAGCSATKKLLILR